MPQAVGRLTFADRSLKNTDGKDLWAAVDMSPKEGKSGKNAQLPEYQRLVRDIQSGKVNAVLKKRNAVSVSLGGGFDTKAPTAG